MNNFVQYSLWGFNRCHKDRRGGTEWEITLQDNHEYIYQNHRFLRSVFIDDHLTSVTFYLRPGCKCEKHLKGIEREMEKIRFNILSRIPNLPVTFPICCRTAIVDENGQNLVVKLDEQAIFSDNELSVFRPIPANTVYDLAVNSKNALQNSEAHYRELFYILQSPHNVIQFIGLYDIMADLIIKRTKATSKEKPQNRVRDFFVKNRKHYNVFVKFFYSYVPYKNGPKKRIKEDYFTKIRNQIAHSKDRGIKNFIKVSESISFDDIQKLLIIINDLLCGAVTP